MQALLSYACRKECKLQNVELSPGLHSLDVGLHVLTYYHQIKYLSTDMV